MEPGHLGLILDSRVVIAAERRGHTVRQILEQFRTSYGDREIGLSVVTIAELTHGIQCARTEERRKRREPPCRVVRASIRAAAGPVHVLKAGGAGSGLFSILLAGLTGVPG